MHYKGTRQSLPTIASELGVDAVIEGTVMRSADRVRSVVLANRMPIYLGALGYVYGRAGKQEDAIAILNELQEVSARRYGSSFWLGVIHTSLGNRDAAFQYLERAYQEHAPMMAYFKVLSLFDDLRPDPRFGALLRQMNYPE